MTEQFDNHKARASAWFRQLRDDIVAAFEGLEDTQTTGPYAGNAPARWANARKKRWQRAVCPGWTAIRGSGPAGSAWSRICRTRTRQRCI